MYLSRPFVPERPLSSMVKPKVVVGSTLAEAEKDLGKKCTSNV